MKSYIQTLKTVTGKSKTRETAYTVTTTTIATAAAS